MSQVKRYDLMFSSLVPNKRYYFWAGTKGTASKDLSAYCTPISKGPNFDTCYNYFYNWIKAQTEYGGGAAIAGTSTSYIDLNSHGITKRILFDGYNKSSNTSTIAETRIIGDFGDPLIADKNGFLAISYFENANLLDEETEFEMVPSLVATNYRGTFYFNWADYAELERGYEGYSYKGSYRPPTSDLNIELKTTAGEGGLLVAKLNIGDNEKNVLNIDDAIPEPEFNIFHGSQTFYVDAKLVSNSAVVSLTSIDLYCKEKQLPSEYPDGSINVSNPSGVPYPGVTIFLVPTKDRKPIFGSLSSYPSARVEYQNIETSDDASAKTKFVFSEPVILNTNKEYGFVIKTDFDSYFDWWKSVEGKKVLGTANTSAGPAGQYIGNYYEYTTDTTNWVPLADTDLKFAVNIAKYAASGNLVGNTTSFSLRMKNMEFIRFNELTSNLEFNGQEIVFQEQSNATGNVSVTNGSLSVVGNGTFFQNTFVVGNDPEYIVIQTDNNLNLRQVLSVISNTSLTLDRPVDFTNATAKFYKAPIATLTSIKNSFKDGYKSRLAILTDSNANSSLKFTNTGIIRSSTSNGRFANVTIEDISINGFAPNINIVTPEQSDYTATLTANYTKSGSNTIVDVTPTVKDVKLFKMYEFSEEDALVLPSRSNEIGLIGGTVYANTPSNSSIIQITPTFTNDYVSPYIQTVSSFVYYYRYNINNDYTNEHTKYGNAYSKHITTKVNLEDDNSAEDLLVYLTAVRPVGTDLKVYAKIYNKNDSDAFDDKDWTLLEYKNDSGGIYSANGSHLVELTYGMGLYPNTEFTLSGSATTTLSGSNVVGSGTTFTSNLAVNDLIKIYSPLFSNSYVVGVVESITNNTLLTLSDPITNNSVVGSGFKIDKLQFKAQAFSNKTNDNIVRYYNSDMIEFDTYNSFALKVVFLSNSQFNVPKIEDIRTVSVSS